MAQIQVNDLTFSYDGSSDEMVPGDGVKGPFFMLPFCNAKIRTPQAPL